MQIHPDIRQAHTLPASYYTDIQLYDRTLRRAFLPSWQWIGDINKLGAYNCMPFELLAGSLQEPLLLTKDKAGELHCLSNVCTHRGKILVEQPQQSRHISCGYHGRCFELDGAFRSMPEFKEAAHFPQAADTLPRLPLSRLGVFLFTSLAPQYPLDTVLQPLLSRMDWYPFDRLLACPSADKTYSIPAHWALYCDNYLEGFHVPFVHPALNEQLDYRQYFTEIFDYVNVQVGIADADAPCFDLPAHSPDYGKRIYAYYWWVFPNLMINIYTWGVSINIVEPCGLNATRVVFKTYLLPDQPERASNAAALDQTELEDEAVVASVQRGIQSYLYRQGRFSPSREQGVHHFHRLLADCLREDKA